MFCLPLRYWTLDDRQVLDGRQCAAQWRVCLCSQWINSLGIKRIYCYCDIWWKRWWLVNRSKVGSWFVHCPLQYIFLCFTPGFEISIIPECLRELSNYIGTLFADASLQSHWLIITTPFLLYTRTSYQLALEIVKYRL